MFVYNYIAENVFFVVVTRTKAQQNVMRNFMYRRPILCRLGGGRAGRSLGGGRAGLGLGGGRAGVASAAVGRSADAAAADGEGPTAVAVARTGPL